MRIIAGTFKSHQFNAPHGHRTHPMSDKARGALFATLGDLDGLTVLDAFAGSGALSFEAVSRGAAKAVAIDTDRNAQQAIADNIRQLNVTDRVKLIRAGAGAWLETSNEQFDILLLDPPYDNLQLPLLHKLAARLADKGLMVVSWPGKQYPPAFSGFTIIKQQKYGDIQLLYYRR